MYELGLVALGIGFAAVLLYLLFGIRKSPDGTIVRFVYVFIGLMFAQWIVKVVAQVCFGYYWFV